MENIHVKLYSVFTECVCERCFHNIHIKMLKIHHLFDAESSCDINNSLNFRDSVALVGMLTNINFHFL